MSEAGSKMEVTPEYVMMLESFLEMTKQQDASLIDGAVFVFIGKGASASQASMVEWFPASSDKDVGLVWHDILLAQMLFLHNLGVDGDSMREMVEYTEQNSNKMVAKIVDSTVPEGEEN